MSTSTSPRAPPNTRENSGLEPIPPKPQLTRNKTISTHLKTTLEKHAHIVRFRVVVFIFFSICVTPFCLCVVNAQCVMIYTVEKECSQVLMFTILIFSSASLHFTREEERGENIYKNLSPFFFLLSLS
jgi:hypothetical protein